MYPLLILVFAVLLLTLSTCLAREASLTTRESKIRELEDRSKLARMEATNLRRINDSAWDDWVFDVFDIEEEEEEEVCLEFDDWGPFTKEENNKYLKAYISILKPFLQQDGTYESILLDKHGEKYIVPSCSIMDGMCDSSIIDDKDEPHATLCYEGTNVCDHYFDYKKDPDSWFGSQYQRKCNVLTSECRELPTKKQVGGFLCDHYVHEDEATCVAKTNRHDVRQGLTTKQMYELEHLGSYQQAVKIVDTVLTTANSLIGMAITGIIVSVNSRRNLGALRFYPWLMLVQVGLQLVDHLIRQNWVQLVFATALGGLFYSLIKEPEYAAPPSQSEQDTTVADIAMMASHAHIDPANVPTSPRSLNRFFRHQASSLHPDKVGGDVSRFQEFSSAHDRLQTRMCQGGA